MSQAEGASELRLRKGDMLTIVFPLNAQMRRTLKIDLPYLVISALLCLLFRPLFFEPSLGFIGTDTYHYHLIQRDLQNVQLREHGRLSLWNPYSFAGVSAVSDPQSGMLYPPNLIHALFSREVGDSVYAWSIVAHMLLAGWGMIWWLRGRGLAALPSLVGAVVFVLWGKWFYQVISLGHLGFRVLVYLPWQLGLVDRIAKRPRLGTSAALGLVTAWAATASHSQILFYLMILLAGYAVLVSLLEPRTSLRPIGLALAVSLAVGVAASAVYWLPVAADLDLYLRGGGLSYEVSGMRPMEVGRWSDYFMQDPRSLKSEEVRFVGIVGPVLAIVALFSRRNRDLVWFFIGFSFFAVWHALGEAGGLHRWLFEYVPGFSLFRIPSRTLILLGLCLGGLAAIGAQFAQERIPGRWGSAVAALLVVLAYADFARFDAPLIRVREPVSRVALENLARRVTAPLGSSRLATLSDLSWLLPMPEAARSGVERVGGYNPLIPSSLRDYLTRSELESAIGFHNVGPLNGLGLDEPDAFEGRKYADLLSVQWVLSDRPIDVRGLSPPVVIKVRQLSRRGGTKTSYLYENEQALPRAMLVRSARYVADRAALLVEIGHFETRSEVLVEDAALAKSYPGAFAEVDVHHAVDTLTMQVDAGDGGFLVLSETWHTGWRATVNGEPSTLFRANGIFQGIALEPGVHDVVVRFTPAAFMWGAWISAVGVALGTTLALISLRDSRREA